MRSWNCRSSKTVAKFLTNEPNSTHGRLPAGAGQAVDDVPAAPGATPSAISCGFAVPIVFCVAFNKRFTLAFVLPKSDCSVARPFAVGVVNVVCAFERARLNSYATKKKVRSRPLRTEGPPSPKRGK